MWHAVNSKRGRFALSLVLAVCILVPMAFVYFSKGSAKTFVLEWTREEQEIVNGTLRIELTFEWQNENLGITAKINDDEYNVEDSFGLVFDRNGNGAIDLDTGDSPFLFLANNCTWSYAYLLKNGELQMPRDWPYTSSYHTCRFIEGTGYIFNISIPKNRLSKVEADIVHIYFFDITDIPPWLSDWVSGQVESWQ